MTHEEFTKLEVGAKVTYKDRETPLTYKGLDNTDLVFRSEGVTLKIPQHCIAEQAPNFTLAAVPKVDEKPTE